MNSSAKKRKATKSYGGHKKSISSEQDSFKLPMHSNKASISDNLGSVHKSGSQL